MDVWQVEIHYKDKTINTDYKIQYIENDILTCYDDELETEDSLYINPIGKEERTIILNDIEEIYIDKIENGEYLGEQYLFWQS